MRPATVGDLLDAAVARDATAPALVDAERRITYGELDHEVACAARVLADAGVRRGTGVAASAANGCDLVVAFLATMRLGARWVGIGRVLPTTDAEYVLQHSRTRVLLTDRDDLHDASGRRTIRLGPDGEWRTDLARAAPRRRSSVDPLAPAALAYTSGTTGRPKGVVHSQHNITLPARYCTTTSDFDATSVVGVALPFTILNVMAISVLPTLFAGRPCVAIPKLDAATVADWVAHDPIRRLVQQRAQIPLSPFLARALARVPTGPVAIGRIAEASFKLDGVRPVGVHIDNSTITALLDAVGSANVRVIGSP